MSDRRRKDRRSGPRRWLEMDRYPGRRESDPVVTTVPRERRLDPHMAGGRRLQEHPNGGRREGDGNPELYTRERRRSPTDVVYLNRRCDGRLNGGRRKNDRLGDSVFGVLPRDRRRKNTMGGRYTNRRENDGLCPGRDRRALLSPGRRQSWRNRPRDVFPADLSAELLRCGVDRRAAEQSRYGRRKRSISGGRRYTDFNKDVRRDRRRPIRTKIAGGRREGDPPANEHRSPFRCETPPSWVREQWLRGRWVVEVKGSPPDEREIVAFLANRAVSVWGHGHPAHGWVEIVGYRRAPLKAEGTLLYKTSNASGQAAFHIFTGFEIRPR